MGDYLPNGNGKCTRRIAYGNGFHFKECGRKAIGERGFCGIHDPVKREERAAKRGPTQFERDMDRIRVEHAERVTLRTENTALRAALSAERASHEVTRKAALDVVSHEVMAWKWHRWCASGCVVCDLAVRLKELESREKKP